MHHSVNKSYYGCFYGWARFMSTGFASVDVMARTRY